MFGDARAFWLPRDVDLPKAYEDSFCFNAKLGMAAIADGVAGGVFSSRWANIVTRELVTNPPDLEDTETFRDWLAACRAQWNQGIDFDSLGYFHRRRLQQVGGGYATLLWLELYPVGEDDPRHGTETYRFLAYAIGDCCLFHVRDEAVLHTFPMTASGQFDLSPMSIGSTNLNQDHLLTFEQCDDYCRAGDLFVLGSDAIACALLRFQEAEQPVEWDQLRSMGDDQWREWILGLRADNKIGFDDTTLVVLPVIDPDADEESDELISGSIVWGGNLFPDDKQEECAEVETDCVEAVEAGTASDGEDDPEPNGPEETDPSASETLSETEGEDDSEPGDEEVKSTTEAAITSEDEDTSG